MNNSVLQTLFPGFADGLEKLHDTLLIPAALICIAGVIFRAYSGSQTNVWGTMARLGIVVIVISQVYMIGDLITQLADAVVAKTGWDIHQNIWQDYQNALATKYNPATSPGNTNPWQFLFNASEATGIALWATFVYGVSMMASTLMMFSRVIQAVLINLEMALSPLFLAAIMIPSLISIATRWGTFFISVCLWTLAFSIADLGTKAMMDIAVNTGNNNAVGAVSMAGSAVGMWFVLALWVLGTSILAPWFITKSLVTTGSHGLNVMPGAIIGAMLTGFSLARGATGNIGSAVGAAQALASPPPQSNQSHAVRPGFQNVKP